MDNARCVFAALSEAENAASRSLIATLMHIPVNAWHSEALRVFRLFGVDPRLTLQHNEVSMLFRSEIDDSPFAAFLEGCGRCQSERALRFGGLGSRPSLF